jgi:hypothetical protein
LDFTLHHIKTAKYATFKVYPYVEMFSLSAVSRSMKKINSLRELRASSAAPVKWLSDFTGQAGGE